MNDARRRLRYWLLAALLERGCDPVRYRQRYTWQRTYRARALSSEECRELLGPLARLRFLPQPPRSA